MLDTLPLEMVGARARGAVVWAVTVVLRGRVRSILRGRDGEAGLWRRGVPVGVWWRPDRGAVCVSGCLKIWNHFGSRVHPRQPDGPGWRGPLRATRGGLTG